MLSGTNLICKFVRTGHKIPTANVSRFLAKTEFDFFFFFFNPHTMRIFFTYVLRLQFKGKYEHFNLIKCHFQKTAVRTGHFELFLINWQKNYNEKKKKNFNS